MSLFLNMFQKSAKQSLKLLPLIKNFHTSNILQQQLLKSPFMKSVSQDNPTSKPLNDKFSMFSQQIRSYSSINGKKPSFLDDPEKLIKDGTLSNVEARKWYLEHEKGIPDYFKDIASDDEKTRAMFDYRNSIRTKARNLMADRESAEKLNKTDPNLTWEEINKKYRDKGFEDVNARNKEIRNASQKSRKTVNDKYGLKE